LTSKMGEDTLRQYHPEALEVKSTLEGFFS